MMAREIIQAPTPAANGKPTYTYGSRAFKVQSLEGAHQLTATATNGQTIVATGIATIFGMVPRGILLQINARAYEVIGVGQPMSGITRALLRERSNATVN